MACRHPCHPLSPYRAASLAPYRIWRGRATHHVQAVSSSNLPDTDRVRDRRRHEHLPCCGGGAKEWQQDAGWRRVVGSVMKQALGEAVEEP